jgi:hypothetical protein
MGVVINKGRTWTQRLRMNGDAAEIDTSNDVDLAVKANVIRALNNGDMETVVNLQSIAGSFTEKGNQAAVKVGTTTITELTDANGVVHEIEDNPSLVSTYIASGMTITGTKSIDIMR